MPIIQHKIYPNGFQLGIWAMAESEAHLYTLFPYMRQQLSTFGSSHRRLERLCSHALLSAMLNLHNPQIYHHASGAPYIENGSISISHSKHFCCILYAPFSNIPLGVDIEESNEKLQTVQQRFLRPDEQASTISLLLLHWCAKEAAYKYFTKDKLKAEELKISFDHSHTLAAHHMRSHSHLPLSFIQTPKYTVVWTPEDSLNK